MTFLFLLPLSNLLHCFCRGLFYSKTPKQVLFEPNKYILTSFTHSVLLLPIYFFSFITSTFIFTGHQIYGTDGYEHVNQGGPTFNADLGLAMEPMGKGVGMRELWQLYA